MASQVSIARKIMFTHIAKDGKTPIYDAGSGKWVMTQGPTAQQLTDSENKLMDVSDKAVAANSTAAAAKTAAETAKTAAANAQLAADSKISESEALNAVRTNAFEITSLIPHPAFRAIEFRECNESGGIFKIWVHFGEKGKPMTSATQGWLGYADEDEVKDLQAEVVALKSTVAQLQEDVIKLKQLSGLS